MVQVTASLFRDGQVLRQQSGVCCCYPAPLRRRGACAAAPNSASGTRVSLPELFTQQLGHPPQQQYEPKHLINAAYWLVEQAAAPRDAPGSPCAHSARPRCAVPGRRQCRRHSWLLKVSVGVYTCRAEHVPPSAVREAARQLCAATELAARDIDTDALPGARRALACRRTQLLTRSVPAPVVYGWGRVGTTHAWHPCWEWQQRASRARTGRPGRCSG